MGRKKEKAVTEKLHWHGFIIDGWNKPLPAAGVYLITNQQNG